MIATLNVPLIPVKRRVRFNTKHGNTYMDDRTKAEMQAVAAEYRRRFPGVVFVGPVKISIVASKPLSKREPKRIKSCPFTKRPDADNIAKAVMDALQEAGAFANDACVVDLHVRKLDQTRTPHEATSITIRGEAV